ncbi:hypothetical protein ACPV5U_04070 [Vibrio mediterranei]
MMNRISFINICAGRFTHADRIVTDLSTAMAADKPSIDTAHA